MLLAVVLAACSGGGATALPDAGTPGKVACGAMTCTATPAPSQNDPSESYCCTVNPAANPGMPPFCVTGNLGACESGNPLYCDDVTDCNAGLHCCNASVRPGLFRCQDTCDGIQLCRGDAECLNGMGCVFRTCGGAMIGTCGALSADLARGLGCP